MVIMFALAEVRARDTPHANLTLYRVAITAGLYRKVVHVCYIPNATTYSGIQRGYLPPSVSVFSYASNSPVTGSRFTKVLTAT